MDENARKRKRDEEGGEAWDVESIAHEQPKEGMKPPGKKSKKEQKKEVTSHPDAIQGDATAKDDATTVQTAMAAKRKAKRQAKLEKKHATKAARKEKKKLNEKKKKLHGTVSVEATNDLDESVNQEAAEFPEDDQVTPEDQVALDLVDAAELKEGSAHEAETPSTASPSSPARSPAFDPPNVQSGTSSISSITENPSASTQAKSKSQSIKSIADSEESKARFRARLEALRAARKADNEDGTPARTRQELIDSRRRKEEQRKAHRKELRQQAKEEERRQKEEALAHGSPLLSPGIMSPHGSHGGQPSINEPMNSFAFGRISFDNGQFMTASLDSMLDPHKKKGPKDPHTALEAAQNRDARIAALDPSKRADIEEKDMWLNARRRAHGEKARDDSSLLKKALKRKEKQKKKSEKDWSGRIEGVAKGKAMRQQKREDNLRKRKEEKGSKGKKANKGVKSKSKARPGFEGSFRTGGKR